MTLVARTPTRRNRRESREALREYALGDRKRNARLVNQGVLGGKRSTIPASSNLPEQSRFALPKPHVRYSSYIDAACMEVQRLSDEQDCYELCLLRLFREEHVARLPGGRALLGGYREMDARVMRMLRRMEADEVQEVYQNIYEEAVVPVVALILAGMWDEAHELYAVACEEVEARLMKRGREEQRDVREWYGTLRRTGGGKL